VQDLEDLEKRMEIIKNDGEAVIETGSDNFIFCLHLGLLRRRFSEQFNRFDGRLVRLLEPP